MVGDAGRPNPSAESLDHRRWSLTGVVAGDQWLDRINSLAPREAMALPPSYVASALDALGPEIARLCGLGPARLLDIVADASTPFARRFAAGQALALRGDPRIDPLAPETIAIAPASPLLGLPKADIERVVGEYRRYGVRSEWIEKESPVYRAALARYGLARHCVTNAEYRRFLGDTGYRGLPESWPLGAYPIARANHPVYGVTPADAEAYAHWLGARTGRRFRLPSEAEWEYAAAGPDGREFPWGSRFDADRCNTLEAGILQTTPVGMFPAGAAPFGHLDMAGNVEEYVADDYRPYPGGREIEDDLQRRERGYRIARGGSFARFRDLARTRRRHGRYDSALYAIGFRLAETIDDA